MPLDPGPGQVPCPWTGPLPLDRSPAPGQVPCPWACPLPLDPVPVPGPCTGPLPVDPVPGQVPCPCCPGQVPCPWTGPLALLPPDRPPAPAAPGQAPYPCYPWAGPLPLRQAGEARSVQGPASSLIVHYRVSVASLVPVLQSVVDKSWDLGQSMGGGEKLGERSDGRQTMGRCCRQQIWSSERQSGWPCLVSVAAADLREVGTAASRWMAVPCVCGCSRRP